MEWEHKLDEIGYKKAEVEVAKVEAFREIAEQLNEINDHLSQKWRRTMKPTIGQND